MYSRTFPTAYSSVRHHEQLPRLSHVVYPTIYHPNISAVQTLAGLHSEVKQLREREHYLQRQLQQYRSALEEVQAVLYTKINKANEMQNFLAPISRLPNEMLLLIFEEAVACQDPGAERRVECTIARVSRRWRELAIHSPRLWRRVCITPRVTPTLLEMYKTRGSRALDIEIWGWKDRRDFQRFDAALETMLDSVGRWRSLSITCVCDTHLSHLTLKLSHVGHFSGLKHFTFRALRPGQTCSVSFLENAGSTSQGQSQPATPCALKTLDAENFVLTGDLGSIHTRTTQSFAKLSSLTLRRYSNDARSFRIMIDFSAFRAMLGAIPTLTTLVLHGQPLRFRSDPAGSLPDDSHGHGIGGEGGASSATITLPHLQTLVLHPGVLKPRYLQHTISAIHAPALRHFELVFPDSKISGQSIVERLFLDPPVSSSSSSSSHLSSSYGPYSSWAPYYPSPPASSASSSSVTEPRIDGRRPRFPRVETVVLHNVSSTGTALAFIQAFPCAMQATLGGVDIGFFLSALRASSGPSVGVRSGSGIGAGLVAPVEIGLRYGTTSASASGVVMALSCDSSTGPNTVCARVAHWRRLRTLTLRQPRPETHHVVLDWIRNEYEREHVMPMLVVEGSFDRPEMQLLAARARMFMRVELVGISTAVPVPMPVPVPVPRPAVRLPA